MTLCGNCGRETGGALYCGACGHRAGSVPTSASHLAGLAASGAPTGTPPPPAPGTGASSGAGASTPTKGSTAGKVIGRIAIGCGVVMLIAVVIVIIYVIQVINYLNKVNNGMGLHDLVTTTGPGSMHATVAMFSLSFRKVTLRK